jgi:hypothetical protein
MKTFKLIVLYIVLLLACGMLEAKKIDNILLYKNCGAWNHNGTVIRSGSDAGRIVWNGKVLRFTPPGETFELKNISNFGFAIRVPETMKDRRLTVKFLYDEGKPAIWNLAKRSC